MQWRLRAECAHISFDESNPLSKREEQALPGRVSLRQLNWAFLGGRGLGALSATLGKGSRAQRVKSQFLRSKTCVLT